MNIETLRENKFWVVFILLILGPLGFLLLFSENLRKEKYITYTLGAWLVIYLIFASGALSSLSYECLTVMDNTFSISNFLNPFVAWAIIGVLVGTLYGSFIAWKKYNLSFKVTLLPLFTLIITLSSLAAFSLNSKSNYSVSDVVEAKTTLSAYQFVSPSTSSQMPFKNGNYYGGNNLVDINYNTAWIGLSKNKMGTDEKVHFYFKGEKFQGIKKMEVVGFNIVNGYCKSESIWKNHSRVNTISIYYNENYIGIRSVPDLFGVQSFIEIPAREVKPNDKITFKISSAVKGKQYKNQTAISELIPVVNIYR